jgi:hypothetical protein
MKSILKIRCIILAASALFLHSSAMSQAGGSGLSFLKLGISGRGVSMGDAMAATVKGAAATHYNPSGILSIEGPTTQIVLMHREWIQDVRTEFFGASTMLDDVSGLGLSINTATVADIQIRTRPGTAEGTFASRDLSIGLTYARVLSEDLSIGITAKYLFEKIFLDQANGFAFDLGAQYKTSIDRLNVGLSLSNLGSMNEMANEKTTLPSSLRVGPAYAIEIEDISSELTLASDMLYIFPEKRSYVGVGGELMFNKTLAARVGYQFGSNGRGLSAGIGVSYGVFTFDYGFVPMTSSLGSGHTFSLALSF